MKDLNVLIAASAILIAMINLIYTFVTKTSLLKVLEEKVISTNLTLTKMEKEFRAFKNELANQKIEQRVMDEAIKGLGEINATLKDISKGLTNLELQINAISYNVDDLKEKTKIQEEEIRRINNDGCLLKKTKEANK